MLVLALVLTALARRHADAPMQLAFPEPKDSADLPAAGAAATFITSRT